MAKQKEGRLESLIKVAEELQALCEFDPPIKTKGKSEEELEEKLIEAGSALEPDDKISTLASKTLKELGVTIGGAPEPEEEEEQEEEEEAEEEKPISKKKKAPVAAEEEEEEEEEPSEEEQEEEEETEEEEEEEEEEEPSAAKSKSKSNSKTGKMATKTKSKPAAKKAAPAKKAAKKEAGKPGVIATIVSLIEGAKKPKGITKDQIVAALVKKFPDRPEESLRSTVNVQVPGRINAERFKVVKSDDGGFYKK